MTRGRRASFFFACSLSIVTFASDAGAAREESARRGWVAQICWPGGVALLRGSDWKPAANQVEFGLFDADARRESWPFAVMTGVWLTYHGGLPAQFRDHAGLFAPGSSRTTGTYEVDLGLRREFCGARRRLQICGGPAIVGGAVQSFFHHDTSPYEYEGHATFGGFAGAGFRSERRHWFWGLQAREVFGRVRIFDRHVDVGGPRIAIELGARREPRHR